MKRCFYVTIVVFLLTTVGCMSGADFEKRLNEITAREALHAVVAAERAFKTKNGRYGSRAELIGEGFIVAYRVRELGPYQFTITLGADSQSFCAQATRSTAEQGHHDLSIGSADGVVRASGDADGKPMPLVCGDGNKVEGGEVTLPGHLQ